MRSLTLILSDLYLPSEMESGAVSRTLALPGLEGLLRFARAERIDDWRKWLVARRGGRGVGTALVARCARGFVDETRLDRTWFATPVHLEARLDHVRLLDRGLARLDEAERAAACEEFARVFGPQYRLHDGGERTLYLSGLEPVPFPTTDPARLLGADIGPTVAPRDAPELRRLAAEVEMWVHGAAFNASRERAGKPRISTLWLWRGYLPEPDAPERPGIEHEYFGGDPLIGSLCDKAPARLRRGVPSTFADLDAGIEHVVAEFAALTGGPHESLTALDAKWIAPATAALRGGQLQEIDLIANDRRFHVTARDRWKIWRPQRGWVEHLMHPARDAKA